MLEKLIFQSRVSEVSGLTVRVIGAHKTNNCGGDANIATFFSELEPLSSKLRAAIRRAKVESVLEDKDETRDDDVRGTFYLLKALSFHPDPAISSGAGLVLKTFNNFGLSIIDESYSSESGLINSLLDDAAMPKMQTAIAQLPLVPDYISELRTSQNDFEQTRIAQEAEIAQESTLLNATSLKKQILDIVNNKIVNYLRIMVPINEAVYGDFARIVSAMIEEINGTVRRRRSKTDNDTTPEE